MSIINNQLSIICATYNASSTIEKFLDSVKSQTSKLFELIIIDGGSTDRTVELIEAHPHLVTSLISEPDKGLYDAWNKGVELATHDWICFVGADDTIRPDFVESYCEMIDKYHDEDVDYISSKVNYVNFDGETVRILGKAWKWKEFKNQMTCAHVGSLHNRRLFEQIGYYDINYKIIGDYELLLRKKDKLNARFLNKILVDMTAGGMSLSFKSLKERFYAHVKTGGMSRLFAFGIFLLGCITLLKLRFDVR
ncbi:glycosyltransferase family 2 protein [Carboxylicivirga caseinilyticus]|uniref:glycosyltransferase family 2 protein n=1 Tax=Carboxylicivirga caseinilyticus TaxID=3417572 RepID=UPI003D3596CF|nr:glycosyltransferase [Marinilabiliaceae bacterium A049]